MIVLSVGKRVLAALGEMDVAAECPGGLLFGDDQREFAAAIFGVGDQALSRWFMMKYQAGVSSRVQRVDMAVRSIWQADDGDGFFGTGTDDFESPSTATRWLILSA